MPPLKKNGKVIKLVNRGPFGLLNKLPAGAKASPLPAAVPVVDYIASDLREFAVPIDSVIRDPNNARMHPERNLEAIRQSLCLYSQVKPVVVRRQTRVVMAGNGTWEAAKSLGWTKIAATFVDMSDVQAAGYGLADNRTA